VKIMATTGCPRNLLLSRSIAAGRRGSVAIEEVMALAVVLPIVIAAVAIAGKLLVLFNDTVASLVGSPFP